MAVLKGVPLTVPLSKVLAGLNSHKIQVTSVRRLRSKRTRKKIKTIMVSSKESLQFLFKIKNTCGHFTKVEPLKATNSHQQVTSSILSTECHLQDSTSSIHNWHLNKGWWIIYKNYFFINQVKKKNRALPPSCNLQNNLQVPSSSPTSTSDDGLANFPLRNGWGSKNWRNIVFFPLSTSCWVTVSPPWPLRRNQGNVVDRFSS